MISFPTQRIATGIKALISLTTMLRTKSLGEAFQTFVKKRGTYLNDENVDLKGITP